MKPNKIESVFYINVVTLGKHGRVRAGWQTVLVEIRVWNVLGDFVSAGLAIEGCDGWLTCLERFQSCSDGLVCPSSLFGAHTAGNPDDIVRFFH